MPRFDDDFAESARVSQTNILLASARDNTDQVEPPDDKPDPEWKEGKASSGTFAPTIGDLLKLRQS